MRAACLLTLVLAFALIVWPARAVAADTKGEPAAGAKAEGAESEGSTNILAPVLDLTIWTSVVFLVLLVVLWLFAWKPLLQVLRKREDDIRASVEEAQRARDEAQRIRTDLEEKMARAAADAQERVDEGRRAAQRQYDEMMAKAKADIQAERDRIHREIEGAKDQALQQIWNQATNLAASISSRALRRPLTPEDHRRLVDEALNELPRAGTGRNG
jgi:F-type H+-transporting ATPase subunit b